MAILAVCLIIKRNEVLPEKQKITFNTVVAGKRDLSVISEEILPVLKL